MRPGHQAGRPTSRDAIVGWAEPCRQGWDTWVGQGRVLTCRQGVDPLARQGWV